MSMIRLKGPGLNDFFAEKMVEQDGPELARERTCGPMREAVERAINRRKAATLAAFDDLNHEDARASNEVRSEVERKARSAL